MEARKQDVVSAKDFHNDSKALNRNRLQGSSLESLWEIGKLCLDRPKFVMKMECSINMNTL